MLLSRSCDGIIDRITDHKLSAALLDCSELKDANSNREYDPRRNPFIDRLCWHLIDSTRNPIEVAQFTSVYIIFLNLNTHLEIQDIYPSFFRTVIYCASWCLHGTSGYLCSDTISDTVYFSAGRSPMGR